mmetsp:Transcript_16682/g.54517  ORF Transcript_16682/g.54517 Transcript_16682/m.54517 type:complete len:458 (-) Transcript_16682:124-1497(-)
MDAFLRLISHWTTAWRGPGARSTARGSPARAAWSSPSSPYAESASAPPAAAVPRRRAPSGVAAAAFLRRASASAASSLPTSSSSSSSAARLMSARIPDCSSSSRRRRAAGPPPPPPPLAPAAAGPKVGLSKRRFVARGASSALSPAGVGLAVVPAASSSSSAAAPLVDAAAVARPPPPPSPLPRPPPAAASVCLNPTGDPKSELPLSDVGDSAASGSESRRFPPPAPDDDGGARCLPSCTVSPNSSSPSSNESSPSEPKSSDDDRPSCALEPRSPVNPEANRDDPPAGVSTEDAVGEEMPASTRSAASSTSSEPIGDTGPLAPGAGAISTSATSESGTGASPPVGFPSPAPPPAAGSPLFGYSSRSGTFPLKRVGVGGRFAPEPEAPPARSGAEVSSSSAEPDADTTSIGGAFQSSTSMLKSPRFTLRARFDDTSESRSPSPSSSAYCVRRTRSGDC